MTWHTSRQGWASNSCHYDGEIQYPSWSTIWHDKTLVLEFLQATPVHRPDPDGSDAGTLTGPTSLLIKGAEMLRNFPVPIGLPGSGTGLRFLDGRTGKPAWIKTVNREPLRNETRFWAVHDDRGKPIGWASLDAQEGAEYDGEQQNVTCIPIASYGDDNAERGLMRGYPVLFVLRIDTVMWIRVGMGQIEDTAWFEGLEPADIVLI